MTTAPLQDRVELISFRTCPFVMRTQIVALEKGVELKTTYIDLADKPQWFLDQSPTGAVPAVKIDDYFIFESSVICDLIDSLTPGTLYPEDVIQKHHNKSWIDFASNLLFKQYAVMTAEDRESYEAAVDEMTKPLAIIERELTGAPFWNGSKFSVIEAAFAPFFHRHKLFKQTFRLNVLNEFPKLANWSEAMLANSSVQTVCNDDLDNELFLNLEKKNSYLLQLA